MELFPAIDLLEGAAVRLAQGDFARVRRFGDPLELARCYAEGGARWVHVVDLDAARTGTPANRAVVAAIAATGLQVQAAGGVRSAADAEELFGAGVARVVLGSAVVGDPQLVEELAQRFPGRVVAGVDHRGAGRDVAVAGWQRSSGLGVAEVLGRLARVPLAAVVVTAIERDGMAAGPDLEGLAEVLGLTAHPVLASGGVRSVEDLGALGALRRGERRLAGVVVGRALLERAVSVQEAIAACAASG